jgi:hypothetical protein
MQPAEFEVAVEVAASMAVSALTQREPVAVWTSEGPLLGRGAPGTRDDLLDKLAVVGQGGGRHQAPATETALAMLRGDRGVSAVALVTGGVPAVELLGYVTQLRRKVRVIVVRVWPPGEILPDVLPGARLLDVDARVGFVNAWAVLAR